MIANTGVAHFQAQKASAQIQALFEIAQTFEENNAALQLKRCVNALVSERF